MDHLGPMDCAVCEEDCEPVNILFISDGEDGEDSLYVCNDCADILGDSPTSEQVWSLTAEMARRAGIANEDEDFSGADA